MSQSESTEQRKVKLTKTPRLLPVARQLDLDRPALTSSLSHAAIQRSLANPRTLAPNDILQLQRTIGNQAVQHMLQRSPQDGFAAGHDFESQLKRTTGGGTPLPKQTKHEFEQSFGTNLDNVRIHTNAHSNQLNRSIQAKAFTHGNDIHFGAGEFNPASSQGKQLLAHELTHTIQQTGGKPTKSVQAKLQVGAANDHYERQADHVATQATQSPRHATPQRQSLQSSISAQGASPLPIQRKLDFKADLLFGGDALSDKYYAMTGEQETYIILKKILDRYHRTHNAMEELRLLERMSEIATAWLNKHDKYNQTPGQGSKASRFMKKASAYALGESNKSKKSFSLHILLGDINAELPQARQAVANAQDEYMNKIQSGGMKYMTGTGIAAAKNMKKHYTDPQGTDPQDDEGAKVHQLIKQHKLTLAEATAIGIYSAGDFKYMNPAVANNRGWLHGAMPKLADTVYGEVFADQQIMQEVNAGTPKKQADSTGTDKNKYKNLFKGSKKPPAPVTPQAPGTQEERIPTTEETQKFEQHAEGARLEGLQHAEMALSGLKKLPDWPGTAYRGLVLTPAEFKAEYPLHGNAVMPAFTSTTLDIAVSDGFINSNRKNGKVNILLELRVTKGKDIATLSHSSQEKEILLLPGATFKVVSITPTVTPTWKLKAQKVVLQQIR